VGVVVAVAVVVVVALRGGALLLLLLTTAVCPHHRRLRHLHERIRRHRVEVGVLEKVAVVVVVKGPLSQSKRCPLRARACVSECVRVCVCMCACVRVRVCVCVCVCGGGGVGNSFLCASVQLV
jgi:hypothetical protein